MAAAAANTHVFSTGHFSWLRWLVPDLGKAANWVSAARGRLGTWGSFSGRQRLQGVSNGTNSGLKYLYPFWNSANTCGHVLAHYWETHSAGQRILAAPCVHKILYNVGIHRVATMTKKFYEPLWYVIKKGLGLMFLTYWDDKKAGTQPTFF